MTDHNPLDALLTPRARSALATISILRSEARADVEKTKAKHKEELRRALDESRDPGCRAYDPPLPETLEPEEIARRALERGLLDTLHDMTNRNLRRHHVAVAPMPYPDGGDPL